MENYMQRIFDIFALKENQGLTTKQIKSKIMDALSDFKNEIQESEIRKIKNNLLNKFENFLNEEQ